MNPLNTQALKVALITGASRRIGAAIARHLHQANFKVIIHCNQSRAPATALADELNQERKDSALVISTNLNTKAKAKSLIDTAIAWAGQLDLLVNNAAIFIKSNPFNLDDAHWDQIFNINVKAPFWLSHSAYPYIATQFGAIINIGDIHAEKPLKDYSVYCQSKAALVMQTKSLAREFAPAIRVNLVAPGAIMWPEHDNAIAEATKQKIINETPLKRHGEAKFIAQAVLALSSNPFITGQILNVDGGRSL